MTGLIKSFANWWVGLTDAIENAVGWCDKNVEAILTSTCFWEM